VIEVLRWLHGGHGDCASARAGYGVRRWVRPAGARVGGRFTALQRARGRAEERSFAATTTFWLRLASGRDASKSGNLSPPPEGGAASPREGGAHFFLKTPGEPGHTRPKPRPTREPQVFLPARWVWLVVRLVCVPLCVRVSRVSRVCPGSPGVFLPVRYCSARNQIQHGKGCADWCKGRIGHCHEEYVAARCRDTCNYCSAGTSKSDKPICECATHAFDGDGRCTMAGKTSDMLRSPTHAGHGGAQRHARPRP